MKRPVVFAFGFPAVCAFAWLPAGAGDAFYGCDTRYEFSTANLRIQPGGDSAVLEFAVESGR